MRLLPPAIALIAAFAIAGCGGSSTLSSDQFNGLRDQGKQFAKNMQTVGADASSCGARANKGSQPDLKLLKTCLAGALGKAQNGLTKLVAYTDVLSSQVDGVCSANLKLISAAMTDVEDTFAKAETEARAGQFEKMQTTLKATKGDAIAKAGNAAEKVCQ